MTDDDLKNEELLIEYLDGELSQEMRRQVEERLAKEPELREQLTQLDKSWRCLEFLERTETDKDLVETTLETVVLSVEESINIQAEKRRKKRFWRIGGLVLGLIGTFVVAQFVGSRLAPDENFFLRVASPIIERLNMYKAVVDEDPEFLPLLAERRVFLPPLPKNMPPVDPKEYRPSTSKKMLESVMPYSPDWAFRRRMEQIQNMDDAFYNQFYWNNKQFKAMPLERKLQLKELHERIELSPRRHELYLTLNNYYRWVKSLQSYERSSLASGKVMERIDKIEALKAKLERAQGGKSTSTVGAVYLKSKDGSNLSELAETLSKLDPFQREQVLNASPDQGIAILTSESQGTAPKDQNH